MQNGLNDEITAKRERNRILGELMYIIDVEHGDFERTFRGSKTGFDLTTDLALLGLSGAGAVAGGVHTKTILAAIATGVKGAEVSVDKVVLQQQTVEAILAQMRAAQLRRKAIIISSMKLSTSDYTLELG
jgi:hypothetical protein